MVIKVKFEDWMIIIITILIILVSGTTVYSIEQYAMLRSITLSVLLGLLLYQFIRTGVLKKKKMFGFLVFVMLCSVALFLRAPNQAFSIITTMFFIVLMTNYCCQGNNAYMLFELTYKFIVALSAISLAFFVILFVIKVDLPSFYVGNHYYKSYFYLFFIHSGYAETIGSFAFYRLQSIFWEPGVFACFLLLALYYYCFWAEEKKVSYFFILTISLILTLSTTGLIVGIGLIMVFILKKMNSFYARILIVAPMCIVGFPVMVNIWMNKKNSATSPSYTLRMYDMTRSLKIWKENFIFGVGYNNTSLFSMEGRVGNSNGFLNWCMTTGLLGLVFIILPFILNCIISKSKERVKFMVFFALFVLMNFTEPLLQTPIMFLLISMSYAAMIMKRGLIDAN